MCGLLRSPLFVPVYMCVSVGPWGTTRRSACPVLRHSESGPLSLSARMWGRMICQWSDCLPHSSHTPPVSVPPRQSESSLPWLPVSARPTGLDECFFFISLVVRLLCGSIFCQFWLVFFVFKLLLSFFWLCEEALCVYLRLHLGRNPIYLVIAVF